MRILLYKTTHTTIINTYIIRKLVLFAIDTKINYKILLTPYDASHKLLCYLYPILFLIYT